VNSIRYESPVSPELQDWLGSNYAWESQCPPELVFRKRPYYRWCELAAPGAILTRKWYPDRGCYEVTKITPDPSPGRYNKKSKETTPL
jgi:hypothetical protein